MTSQKQLVGKDFKGSLDELLQGLDMLEENGSRVLQKIENSLSISYPLTAAIADLNTLLTLLRTFGSQATQVGAASLSHASSFTQEYTSNTLATFTKVKDRSSAVLFNKKEQIRANAQAAWMAVRTELNTREGD
ncbi:202_t:CDS:2 [Paraglomus brasilianum]|uniref:202_t:CDS:1 n=1 Tax=Paraglomus brasilianum TaxID=144538 RepID=A0A9N9A4W9_9GLOM|nr:202_t:CDS:2 [Paraglomus brasilianum]